MIYTQGSKILILSILCPIAPSDIACFLSASTGMRFKKYIRIIILSNIPMLILFSNLGASIFMSMELNIALIIVLLLMGIVFVKKWKEEKRKVNYA